MHQWRSSVVTHSRAGGALCKRFSPAMVARFECMLVSSVPLALGHCDPTRNSCRRLSSIFMRAQVFRNKPGWGARCPKQNNSINMHFEVGHMRQRGCKSFEDIFLNTTVPKSFWGLWGSAFRASEHHLASEWMSLICRWSRAHRSCSNFGPYFCDTIHSIIVCNYEFDSTEATHCNCQNKSYY